MIYDRRIIYNAWCVIGSIFLCGVILIIASCQDTAHASEIATETAIRCILGEASNQKFKGMLAVAGALRNRGTIKGVFGCSATHIDKEPSHSWALAHKAWAQSAYLDLTKGATHWEALHFPTPYWAPYMDKTVLIGDHQFYKEK